MTMIFSKDKLGLVSLKPYHNGFFLKKSSSLRLAYVKQLFQNPVRHSREFLPTGSLVTWRYCYMKFISDIDMGVNSIGSILANDSTNLTFKWSGVHFAPTILLLIVNPTNPMWFLGMISYCAIRIISFNVNCSSKFWFRTFDERKLIVSCCLCLFNLLSIFINVLEFQILSQIKSFLSVSTHWKKSFGSHKKNPASGRFMVGRAPVSLSRLILWILSE